MSQAFNLAQMTLRAWLPGDAAALAAWRNQTGEALNLSSGGGEAEWLILAEGPSAAPVACLRLVEQLGLQTPRFSYHVGRVVHAAAELGLFRTRTTLLLGNDHSGESEIADLACAPGLPAEVQLACLTHLIQAALQYVRAQPARFGERLIVEFAGVRDAQGAAPFWLGLGAHFYAGDPLAAQARFGAAWRSHLAALLPRQILYLSFLNQAAQAAVGQVGMPAKVAAQASAVSGFAASQHVRIDDGGPVWDLHLR